MRSCYDRVRLCVHAISAQFWCVRLVVNKNLHLATVDRSTSSHSFSIASGATPLGRQVAPLDVDLSSLDRACDILVVSGFAIERVCNC